MRIPGRQVLLPLLAVLALVTATYANHFQNGYHFDDFHTVTTNPYIRDLHNIPLIFEDADTFSTLPANRGWRPLVTTTLAFDYALAKGLRPGVFQLTDFCWFLIQLCLMFALFRHLLDFARPDPSNRIIALFATALYGVHPAIAETVNYIIQRGDIFSTLGVIAGLLIYIRWPHRRNQGWYLIPVLLGLLSKPPALVFPAILFVYLLLFENTGPVRAFVRSVPALLLSIGLGILQSAMTPKSYDPGAWPARDYRITQPLVALRYFRNFFAPLWLSADTDHVAETSIWHGYAWLGWIFVIVLLVVAIYCGPRNKLRPIAFGIWWFILALLPTSLFPLAEIENDHRMYFPFVGLALSLVYGAALFFLPRDKRGRIELAIACIMILIWVPIILALLPTGIFLLAEIKKDMYLPFVLALTVVYGAALFFQPRERRGRVELAIASSMILAAAVHGTWLRNQVWLDEATLWHDVTLKSPENGRGLMNYGLTLMEKSDYISALSYFTTAEKYSPDYYVLEINLGIANGALNNDAEAERHFARSLELAPQDAQALYFYASWLRDRGRYAEAIRYLNANIEYNPAYLDARYLLMWVYHDLGDTASLDQTARDLLAQFPTDDVAQTWLAGKTPAQ